MKVLITGAGGLGSLTADLLATAGHDVLLVDLAEPPTLPDAVDFQPCDVTDFSRLSSVIESEQITDIVHTAALLSSAIRMDPLKGYTVNTIGTANVLQAARDHDVRRVVIASSTTVEYSSFRTHASPVIEEDFPTRCVSGRPQSIYVASKLANEHLALLHHDLYGLDVVILRYGAVVNPWVSTPTSVPDRLLQTLATAGQEGATAILDDPVLVWNGREEFIDVRDCAAATIAALDATQPTQRVYNVAPGNWHSLDEFIAEVKAALPGLRVQITTRPTGGFAGFPYERPAPSATTTTTRELRFTATHDLASTIHTYLSTT